LTSIYEDARSQRHVRRIMAFATDDNPLWSRLAAFERLTGSVIATERLLPGSGTDSNGVPSKPYDLLGVSRTYFGKWRDGEQSDVSSAFRQIRALREALVRAGDMHPAHRVIATSLVQVISAYLATSEADAPIRESGLALGYRSIDDVRMAIDRLFHRRYPLFKRPYLRNAETASEEVKQLRGLNIAWMRRGPDLFLQCTMDFRYAVELPEGHCIRVKLDVPIINDHGRTKKDKRPATPRHTPYDGWIMLIQHARVFLTFETRHGDSRSDCIFMIIANWADPDGWRGGNYLTAHQDNERQAAADVVLLTAAEHCDDLELGVVRRGDAAFDELQARAAKMAPY
jgi:hypothetical protein